MTYKLLDDGSVVPGFVMLSKSGEIDSGIGGSVSTLQQDMLSHPGYYPAAKQFRIFSTRINIGNAKEDLWDGPTDRYVFPVAEQQMRVISSNAADSSAGTGARKLLIEYLDSSFNELYEVIVLNGTTPVLTSATNIFRINRVRSIEVGTNGYPVGNISLQNTAGNVTYAYQAVGKNIASQCAVTVPQNKNAYISWWSVSSGAATSGHITDVGIFSTVVDGVKYPGVFTCDRAVMLQDQAICASLQIPIMYPPGTDVLITAISDASAANATAFCEIDGWLEQIS